MSKKQKKGRSAAGSSQGQAPEGPNREEAVNAVLKASFERLQRRQYEKAETILRLSLIHI